MVFYIFRRFVNYFFLSMIATCLAYIVSSLALDPAAKYYGRNPQPSQQTIDNILNGLGVNPDVPVLQRLWDWLVTIVVHGSLGTGVNGVSIGDQIISRAGVSLRLLLIGSLIGAIVGVTLGVWGAVRQYKLSDQVVTYGSYLIFATPTFVVGVLLMIGATALNGAVGMQLITFTGEYSAGLTGSWWELALDRGIHLLLPTIALVLIGAAGYSRYQRSVMLDVLSADFIRTARAKGRSRNSALVRHGVRVALIPMSTFFAYSFGTLVSGSIMLEIVFSFHGMGEFALNAISQNDINAVAGTTLFVAILILFSSTLSEVLYAALDPRVRN
ncbi:MULTISPECIES: ABC transporter permease [unclassified Cryobacterium]|uniref:ABC transporter permease n=1 Tax=unclassified Cryobacterium TaxID=2649013 RepID=UPI00106CF750|nr:MULTISPECIES: ABC transporter permease [unclassified Cryobacterium]TFC33581.1 ABC transporter permease [Cryobacterium sp. TMT2-42-4]TFC61882.1 ABC transporter permease [Cryobacterium sp. TMT2-15-1]